MQNGFTAMNLGLDLDGLLDDANAFFRQLTGIWPGNVVVISYRDNYAKARDDLQRLGITYDELVLVDSFDGKADVIAEKAVGVYFDDQTEMLNNIPEGVHVFLYRNGGNFDFDDHKWMLSNKTGKVVC